MLKNRHGPIELLASSATARQWSPENTTQNNKGSLCTYKLHTHQLWHKNTNATWIWQHQLLLYMVKPYKILVSRLVSVLHKHTKTVAHHRSKWLELYFCLLLSESHSSQSQWYPFWNWDIATSQSALKQSYSETTGGQNSIDEASKLHSAAIQFPWTIAISSHTSVLRITNSRPR